MVTLEEYDYHRSLTEDPNYKEADVRLKGLYEWLQNTKETREIIDAVRRTASAEILLSRTGDRSPPPASTPEEIAAVGFKFMELAAEGSKVAGIGEKYNIKPSSDTRSLQNYCDEVFRRFIDPALDFLRRRIAALQERHGPIHAGVSPSTICPPEIRDSLRRFSRDHPEYDRTGFIMMRFGNTQVHERIAKTIKRTLDAFGIEALRADDQEYHDDLFGNVLTYIYGCRFGIAVFERLEGDEFNPNVSLAAC